MIDIGRISSRRWAIGLLVFLCVSALLFIAPWILSVFYDSDPYDTWSEEARFKSQEKQGNMTLSCTPSGPCVACTITEKADADFKCSPTGYHKPQTCVEEKSVLTVQSQGATTDPVQGKDQRSGGDQHTKRTLVSDETLEEDDSHLERLLIDEDVLNTMVIFKTCIPPEVKEKLSVFGFEGVVLVCLLISAPAVHYRKRRGASPQIMQRIPSSARF